jgi:hypothetical protein
MLAGDAFMAAPSDRTPVHPTDFTSRSAKLRLFVILAGVMLVLGVAERALDPEFREWLVGGNSQELSRDQSPDKIDTRLPPQPAASSEPDSFIATAAQSPPTGWHEALSRVEDDTLFMRPAERAAWQLLEARVRETDPAALQRESLGRIAFTQLFQQPEVYRGKAVTVRGTVMNASRVAASDDEPGSSERYVLWIMPEDGPTSPIVVYALAMPAGFPPIERQSGGRMTKLHEEVALTGIFLKRGSYHAQDGPRTAPVIIANVPDWKPPVIATTQSTRYGLDSGWLLPTAGAALALAIVFVAVAYWFSIRNQRKGRGVANPRLVAADFRDVKVGPSTADVLRRMEQDRGD